MTLQLTDVHGRIPWPGDENEAEDEQSGHGGTNEGSNRDCNEGSTDDTAERVLGLIGGHDDEDSRTDTAERSSKRLKIDNNSYTEPGSLGDESVLESETSNRDYRSTSGYSDLIRNSRDQADSLVENTDDESSNSTDTNSISPLSTDIDADQEDTVSDSSASGDSDSTSSVPAQTDADQGDIGVSDYAQPPVHNPNFRNIPVSGRYDDVLFEDYPYGTIEVPWHISSLLRGPPSAPNHTISIQDYADMDRSLQEQPPSPTLSGEDQASSLGKRKRN